MTTVNENDLDYFGFLVGTNDGQSRCYFHITSNPDTDQMMLGVTVPGEISKGFAVSLDDLMTIAVMCAAVSENPIPMTKEQMDEMMTGNIDQANEKYRQDTEAAERVRHLAECMKHVGAANFGEFLEMAERYGVDDPDAVVAAYDKEQQ